MKKQSFVLMLAIVLTLALSACSNNEAAPIESTVPVKEMVDKMITEVEQPSLMELDADSVKQQYHLDPALLEDYTVRIPMMNVKTNEISVLKVKDEKDIPTIETAIKQCAADVQKQFETYLPDQYENAKNYKLVTKGNYLLFVISEDADELVKSFDSFFVQK
ncbi:protein of unknown function [Paenibacillus uliginis N3/975]|uniref:DUF4358 domain-containing protein n=1 Tax=Paenibacillus uliginis N3/975 TaxID=1313296 RepID=A0A1X7HVV6_9BACL|nr:DUF4358 domain-containing protein [Paenibacillus uliginis]SMF92954.1 protein of unknown function [Paenibacillus uliginis N3/975]